MIPYIEQQKPKKSCQNCANFRRVNWPFIEELLRKLNANTRVVKAYHDVYTGSNGRCAVQNNKMVHKQDYCHRWTEQESEPLQWPKDEDEFAKLLEPLLKGKDNDSSG